MYRIIITVHSSIPNSFVKLQLFFSSCSVCLLRCSLYQVVIIFVQYSAFIMVYFCQIDKVVVFLQLVGYLLHVNALGVLQELQAQLTQRGEQYHRLLDQGESMLLARGGEETSPGATQTQQNLALLQNKWAGLNAKMDDRRV